MTSLTHDDCIEVISTSADDVTLTEKSGRRKGTRNEAVHGDTAEGGKAREGEADERGEEDSESGDVGGGHVDRHERRADRRHALHVGPHRRDG